MGSRIRILKKISKISLSFLKFPSLSINKKSPRISRHHPSLRRKFSKDWDFLNDYI